MCVCLFFPFLLLFASIAITGNASSCFLSTPFSMLQPVHLNPPTNHLHILHARRSAPAEHLHKSVIVPTIAAALPLMTVAALFFFFFIHWYRKLLKQKGNNKTSPEDGSSLKICRFKYWQLKKATKCFSESQKLGKGGFGVVYRGVLKNGKEVAVKKLDISSFQGEREFQNELTICSKLHSPHVVRLLGFCSHGKRVRLLVYECMQNRSLQEALFEKGLYTPLDWDKRFKIILDVVKALEFLHLHCDPPIIHGDVKPSNVLLDSNFSARIADFGLARFKSTQEFDAKPSPSVQKVKEYTCQECRIDTSLAGSSPNSMVKSLHPEISSRVYAEAASVQQSLLLTKEVSSPIRVSESDQGGELDDAMAAFSTPCFSPSLDNDEFLVNGETEARLVGGECGQQEQLKGDVNVRQDVESCGAVSVNEWSRPMPMEFCSNDQMGPSTLHSLRQGPNNDRLENGDALNWLGSDVQRRHAKCAPENGESMRAKGWSTVHGLDVESVAREKRKPKPTHRKSREWWKEEYFAELSNKNRCHVNVRKKRSKTRSVGNWKELLSGELGGDLSGELRGVSNEGRNGGSCKKWLGNSRSGDLSWLIRGGDRGWSRTPSQEAASDIWSGELNATELINRCQWSGDLSRSGELMSRDLSSTTTSMRGTICYIAPEYGGNGVLSEKSDIYSLGVLMLVILSGRRPIQVTASPLKEFERANLISWARYLSQSGKLMDLMDPALHGEYDLRQAGICINVALFCLQRVPERRPNVSQVVKTLLGGTMVSPLRLQLSPPSVARKHHKPLSELPMEHHSVKIIP